MFARRAVTLAAAALVSGLACKDTVTNVTSIPNAVEIYTATLTGANERPTAVSTSATGRAVITVLGNLVSWKVDVTNIDSIILGHIHHGAVDSAGPVVVNFNPAATGLAFSGTATTGSATVADSILTEMRTGIAYVNVHTQKNKGGEIRGQLQKQ